MQTTFTEDQETFRETVVRFLQDKSQPADVRRLMESESGYDAKTWEQLCSEVGLTATHFPEEYGGYGFGVVELGIVAEAMGRYLYCGPFFASSVMAGYAIMIAGSEEARASLLPGIAAGTTIATLVLDDLNAPDKVGASITAADGSLTGAASLVLDGGNADRLIVIAAESSGLGLYALAADSEGVSLEPVQALDPTRKLSRVRFDAAQAAFVQRDLFARGDRFSLRVGLPVAVSDGSGEVTLPVRTNAGAREQQSIAITLAPEAREMQYGFTYNVPVSDTGDVLLAVAVAENAGHIAGQRSSGLLIGFRSQF